ncbi:MAG: transposase [Flavobacterium sp.]|nr:transposase [Flavobacterium sp.]
MSKFKDTFRIESIRLKEWDYTTPWWYYVTINTKNHIPYFGKIINGEMILNNLGRIVETEWKKTMLLRPNVELDNFIIMPNHLHGIIILNEIVETRRGVSLRKNSDACFGRPAKNSLSIIINQFKGSVTHQAKKNGYSNFSWQSGFFERIIRNEIELSNIRYYIEQNPANWKVEKTHCLEIDIKI